MKKIRFYISVLATILLFSCSESESVFVPDVDNDYESIRFNPVVSSGIVQTRILTGLENTDFPNGNYDIGIYMMEEGNTTDIYTPKWNGYLTPAGQYNNVRAKMTASGYGTGSPEYVWSSFAGSLGGDLTPANRMTFGNKEPGLSGKKADFYAYYPHVQTTNTLDNIPFTLSKTSDITDVLYTVVKEYPYENVQDGIPVDLDFRHALSLISFKVINKSEDPIIIFGCGISDLDGVNASTAFVYNKCVLDLSSVEMEDQAIPSSTASCDVNLVDSDFGMLETELASNNRPTLAKDAYDEKKVNITIPPKQRTLGNGAAVPKIRTFLKIGYTSTSSSFDTSYAEVTVPTIDASTGTYGFKQGYRYVYEITVTSSGIRFDGVKVALWDAYAGPNPSVII